MSYSDDFTVTDEYFRGIDIDITPEEIEQARKDYERKLSNDQFMTIYRGNVGVSRRLGCRQ